MAMPDMPWWSGVQGSELAQGDYLPRCLVPFFTPDYGTKNATEDVLVKEYNCIVVTQSCDLEQHKAPLVALCPIYHISEYQKVNPKFSAKGIWEQARRGRFDGLHMVASQDDPMDNQTSLVVDFREVYSLPFEYLSQHAFSLGRRLRLQPPYLEHFSQAFARFFMRVGLPSSIPRFT